MRMIQVEHLGQYWIFLEDTPMPSTPPSPGKKWHKVPSGWDQVDVNKDVKREEPSFNAPEEKKDYIAQPKHIPSLLKPKETEIKKFGKTFAKTGSYVGSKKGLGEKDFLNVKNLTPIEKKNWGKDARCFPSAYDWAKKNSGKVYLSEDQSHAIAIKGDVVYDGVKDREFNKEDYFSQTDLVFDELEESA